MARLDPVQIQYIINQKDKRKTTRDCTGNEGWWHVCKAGKKKSHKRKWVRYERSEHD